MRRKGSLWPYIASDPKPLPDSTPFSPLSRPSPFDPRSRETANGPATGTRLNSSTGRRRRSWTKSFRSFSKVRARVPDEHIGADAFGSTVINARPFLNERLLASQTWKRSTRDSGGPEFVNFNENKYVRWHPQPLRHGERVAGHHAARWAHMLDVLGRCIEAPLARQESRIAITLMPQRMDDTRPRSPTQSSTTRASS
jgi:hypothetical protein